MRTSPPTPLLAAALLAAFALPGPPARATPILDFPAPPLDGLLADIPPTPAPVRTRLLPLIRAEAERQGLPTSLADAVAVVETGYTENALGNSGEIGLMQVMPGTAAALGFRGSLADLYRPATNIHYGVTYLARAWAVSGGNACRALMKYRAGLGEEGFSPLSIQYCQRATAWLRTQDQALADNVALNTPAAPTLGDPYVITLAGRRPTRIDTLALADIAGVADLVVERMPVAAWHISRGGRMRPNIQAVVDAANGGDSDAHVISIPGAGR
jgi:soluble lytic murein transglycosylase-like protein